jgi:hypothetical protein
MVLNGRIYQYGYYQAVFAALLVPAILIGEAHSWLRLGRLGRSFVVLGTASLLCPGVLALARESQEILRAKTLAVGEGVDRFYAFPRRIDSNGAAVGILTGYLRQVPPGGSLLVLPEGVMINYLSRMPGTVAPCTFYSAATAGGREEQIVGELEKRPPDWVVIISRDLSDYGVDRYGADVGNGRLILQWVNANYSSLVSFGGDPLDRNQFGGIILKRKVEGANWSGAFSPDLLLGRSSFAAELKSDSRSSAFLTHDISFTSTIR